MLLQRLFSIETKINVYNRPTWLCVTVHGSEPRRERHQRCHTPSHDLDVLTTQSHSQCLRMLSNSSTIYGCASLTEKMGIKYFRTCSFTSHSGILGRVTSASHLHAEQLCSNLFKKPLTRLVSAVWTTSHRTMHHACSAERSTPRNCLLPNTSEKYHRRTEMLHAFSFDLECPQCAKRHFSILHPQTLLAPSQHKTASITPVRLLQSHTQQDLSFENANYRDYLYSKVSEFKALSEDRMKGEDVDHSRYMFLESVAATLQELETAHAELADLRSIVSGETDKELQAMAEADVGDILQHTAQLEEKLVDALVGPEPADQNDVMLEVSAGVGGQEAMLFTAEIFNMYTGFAAFKGWSFEPVDFEKSDMGGVRRACALLTGRDVYRHMKFEAGVHRVQRVPKTERTGRVHTSTMTVAVLPQPSQIDISVNPKDLNVDTFRASGAGGQHVNTTSSAVRITHKPSGTVAECQQERSQIKNREKAMKILLSRLYQTQVEEQEQTLRKYRKLQVGSAGRSEKIRTYNYSQDRITDHRGPTTYFNMAQFMSGEDSIDELIETLMTQSRLEILQAMVDEFIQSRKQKTESQKQKK